MFEACTEYTAHSRIRKQEISAGGTGVSHISGVLWGKNKNLHLGRLKLILVKWCLLTGGFLKVGLSMGRFWSGTTLDSYPSKSWSTYGTVLTS